MMRRVLCGMLLLGLLGGCSTMQVTTDYAVDVDFSQFRTFQYSPSGLTLANANPLADRRIVAALNRHMSEAGFTEADTDPDLRVSYYAAVNQQIVLMATHTGYRWDRYGRWHHDRNWSTATVRSTMTTHTFRRGTMVIDVWDSREQQLVWRGTVSDYLHDDPAQVNAQIELGIARAFEGFPARP